MAQKKSYSRYFIILQEDEKGYSLASDKIASGYAKLETKNDKCKISYYVQNLKKDKTPYYMILICNKKDTKKMINIGEMNIDDYGRADISYEYPVNNISNSDISIDKVSGAAVARILDNNIISVMSGFASMEVPEWKSFDIIKDKAKINSKPKSKQNQSITDKKDDKKGKESENKSIFDKYEENIEAKKSKDKEPKSNTEPDNTKDAEKKNELNKEKKAQDTNKDNNSNGLKQKSEQLTNKISDLVENKDKEELKRIRNEHSNKDIDVNEAKEFEDEDEIYVDNSSMEFQKNYRVHGKEAKDNFFEDLIEGFKETSNISKELKRCKWYKVPARSIQDMQDVTNYNKYTFVYYPMTAYYNYIENYYHFLIGYKYDKNKNVKYIIYGIPGTKNKEEQPYGGRSGFVTWIPQKGKNKLGYWLMFYDFRTGTVDIPVKDDSICR
ncbi:hypothetical protein ACSVC9_15225 [Clostridium sp. LBM24168]